MKYVLAIDQGTTSTRAIVFDESLSVVAQAQEEFPQIFPKSGWVEHDPSDLWGTTAGTCRDNAVVWQDRRTAGFCKELRDAGHSDMFADRTGLLVDPYFSATKLKWILDHVEGARTRAINGDLLFGTVDTFLIWKLTGGQSHVTDATNAARTMLLFGRPIPICGVAGDQQAATIGQACFDPGMLKSTYGTGCFALLNTGDTPVKSKNRLLTTIAYQLDGKPTYALEGSIFIAGAVVQWLRDGLKIIREASETQPLAEGADGSQSVVLVPAFTGLGAPYWNPECRGAVFGLTRNSGPNELARAALESVGYQTRDLLDAMRADSTQDTTSSVLRVDGGMSASNWAMQFLADITDAPVDRPKVLETTALGVAWLAGMKVGAMPRQDEFAKQWELDCQFQSQMAEEERDQKFANWQRAVNATLAY